MAFVFCGDTWAVKFFTLPHVARFFSRIVSVCYSPLPPPSSLLPPPVNGFVINEKFCELWSDVCWLKSRLNYNLCCLNLIRAISNKSIRWKIKRRFNTTEWAWSYKLVFNFHVSQVANSFCRFSLMPFVWVECKQSQNRAIALFFFNLCVTLLTTMSVNKAFIENCYRQSA